jgi:hypothetical protein
MRRMLSVTTPDMLTGGCFCGRLRYEADAAPFNQTHCHCSICRRTTGAPYVAWFSVARERFRLKGEPTRFRSSGKATRSFCPECGTQITFELDGTDEVDINTSSLDQPERVPPVDHIYTASRVEWVKLADGLPQFRGPRSGG